MRKRFLWQSIHKFTYCQNVALVITKTIYPIHLKGELMILFISGLLLSLALIKLGSYSTIVYLFTTITKVLLEVLLGLGLAMLLKKLWGIYRSSRLPRLPHSWFTPHVRCPVILAVHPVWLNWQNFLKNCVPVFEVSFFYNFCVFFKISY